MILVMFVVTVLMFSSLVFAFEREGVKDGVKMNDDLRRHEDWSFYDCIWWGLMTLTTVGYHQQPRYILAAYHISHYESWPIAYF